MTMFSNFDDEELLALADWNFQKDEHELALEKVKVLTIRGTAPIQSYALMGRLYATLGLFAKAKEAFQHYLENQPDENLKINETFQMGLVERDMGNLDNAMNIWDKLLSNHPNHPPALYHSAVILSQNGKQQEAIELLNRILETADDNDGHIQMADQLLSKLVLH